MSRLIGTTEEHAALVVDGEQLEVLAVEGQEALGVLFRYVAECTEPGEQRGSLRARLGRPAALTLRDAFGGTRIVRGIVTRARRSASDAELASLVLELRPEMFPLSLGQSLRAFHGRSSIDIAGELLAPFGEGVRWEIREEHEARDYCVQYRESDWTFLLRLFEEDGIYFWFDHEDGATRLVITDGHTDDLVGGADIRYDPALDMNAAAECVQSFGPCGQATPEAHAVRSFDPRNPDLALGAAEPGGVVEAYDAPGAGPRSAEACRAQVRQRVERAAALRTSMRGTTSSARLVPGRALSLHGHALPELDGAYRVTSNGIAVTQRRRADGTWDRTYRCAFQAIPRDRRFRLAETTPPALQGGLQSGRVVGAAGQEIHPSGAGEVRVKLHWDRAATSDERAGHWARVQQRNTAGSMLLPRMGWNVMVAYEEGNVVEPRVVNRFYDATHPPPYPLPEGSTRLTFKTATSPGDGSFNEIHLEDTKGAERLFMNASRNLTARVNNDATTHVGRDRKVAVAKDREVAVTAAVSELVQGSQTADVKGKQSISVAGPRLKTIAGSEDETIGGSRQLEAGTAHTNSTTGTRSLTVGGAMIDITLGPIVKSADRIASTIIGGAHAQITPKSVSESAEAVANEMVGGVRLDLASKSHVREGSMAITEIAGGIIALSSATDQTHDAEATLTITAGGAMSLTAGPDVVFEGETEIVVQCGKSSITIDGSSVTMSSRAIEISGGTLASQAPKINHN